MLIHSDPNNMNSIGYHLIIVRYSMKTLHWYFPWATALHLHNMTSRGGKLQQLHCYHPFSDSLDIYLTKNHYENYSPKMVPIAKIWGPGSWTNCTYHMMTSSNEKFSALLAICAGNSPVQRPVTRSFDVFFDLRLNKHTYEHIALIVAIANISKTTHN